MPARRAVTATTTTMMAMATANDGVSLYSDSDVTGPCCAPGGCLRLTELASDDDVRTAASSSSSPPSTLASVLVVAGAGGVRVRCSSDECDQSGWMHGPCFELWQAAVLNFLRTCGGRARQWSDRQRANNLWTKKGYELAFKVGT